MKYAFLIQGEGRGHMTQAIALRNILVEQGHEIVAVMVGKSPQRIIPDFFKTKIKNQIITYDSPNFITAKNSKGIQIFKSLWYGIIKFNKYRDSIDQIHKALIKSEPDVIINFYEILAGLYFRLYKPTFKHICIGHQFLIFHPSFKFPKGAYLDRFAFYYFTKLTSYGASKLLALSFRELPHHTIKNTFVVPPLLRDEVINTTITSGRYILAYILNDAYRDELIEWHNNNQEYELHFFSDAQNDKDEIQLAKNIFWHKLNDELFIKYMAGCKAFATTAGFESVCEAMYLQKPVMTVPTKNHYEQRTNAIDAELSGLSIPSQSFNLNKLLDFTIHYPHNSRSFQTWALSARKIFIEHLTQF